MTVIDLKISLSTGTEIRIKHDVDKSLGRDAGVTDVAEALGAAMLPAAIRALGLRTESDHQEMMNAAAEQASAMVESFKDATADAEGPEDAPADEEVPAPMTEAEAEELISEIAKSGNKSKA